MVPPFCRLEILTVLISDASHNSCTTPGCRNSRIWVFEQRRHTDHAESANGVLLRGVEQGYASPAHAPSPAAFLSCGSTRYGWPHGIHGCPPAWPAYRKPLPVSHWLSFGL